MICTTIINSPGVARAVLPTLLSLSHSLTESSFWKLDGVGPVENRPSIEKLHNFVKKRRRKRKKISEKLHVTHDT